MATTEIGGQDVRTQEVQSCQSQGSLKPSLIVKGEICAQLAEYREARHKRSIELMGSAIVRVVEHQYGDYKSTVAFSDEYIKRRNSVTYRPELFE